MEDDQTKAKWKMTKKMEVDPKNWKTTTKIQIGR